MERENRLLASCIACRCAIQEARLNQTATHVELYEKGLRTRVQFPPAPPLARLGPSIGIRWVAFVIGGRHLTTASLGFQRVPPFGGREGSPSPRRQSQQ